MWVLRARRALSLLLWRETGFRMSRMLRLPLLRLLREDAGGIGIVLSLRASLRRGRRMRLGMVTSCSVASHGTLGAVASCLLRGLESTTSKRSKQQHHCDHLIC